ncbi:SUF system NifU family Fe-S cluster assembly protein [SAR202 cluster bacterium AD-493-K16_JPT_193m]|nr:SUF system NifU family Fe-S cluster assembly protein [SAR202 cluster bacterium AD-493-K16_JPT_193m]
MASESLDSLYQEIVLDHYKKPRNYGLLENAEIHSEGFNPFCGDRVVITAKLGELGTISEVGFKGEGCAISQSSASMMTEAIQSHTIEEAKKLVTVFKEMMQGKALTQVEEENLGSLTILQGVREYPVRIKCALLTWSTLQDAILELEK